MNSRYAQQVYLWFDQFAAWGLHIDFQHTPNSKIIEDLKLFTSFFTFLKKLLSPCSSGIHEHIRLG